MAELTDLAEPLDRVADRLGGVAGIVAKLAGGLRMRELGPGPQGPQRVGRDDRVLASGQREPPEPGPPMTFTATTRAIHSQAVLGSARVHDEPHDARRKVPR